MYVRGFLKSGKTVLFHFLFFSGWLEDIGLPQYKDAFSEGSVDGRMLNYLTFVSIAALLRAVDLFHNQMNHHGR